MILDLVQIAPMKTSIGRKIDRTISSNKVTMYIQSSHEWGGGKESKKVIVNRLVPLDELFFEGLGLWRGEGGRKKGIYFGNSNPSLLRRFLEFAELKIGLTKEEFRVTINTPHSSYSEDVVKEKWSKELLLPVQNFTRICVDSRITREYAQVYFNSVILAELMSSLYTNSKEIVLRHPKLCVHLLRGLFAAEGSVLLKKSGVLHHITFSSKDNELIQLLEQCLRLLGVMPGKYMVNGMNLQIYGLPNFRRIRGLGIHTLHPEKCAKFERGFASYKRVNVLDGEEARALILQQLSSSPKTYDDLAAALGKARTTIQAHHIPILEREGKVRRVGKREQVWLWALAKPEMPSMTGLGHVVKPVAVGSTS